MGHLDIPLILSMLFISTTMVLHSHKVPTTMLSKKSTEHKNYKKRERDNNGRKAQHETIKETTTTRPERSATKEKQSSTVKKWLVQDKEEEWRHTKQRFLQNHP